MDAYPLDYVGHNLPLVLLSGIEPAGQESLHLPSSDVTYPQLNENGIQIFSDFPPLTDATAKRLLVDLLAEDASKSPWNARAYGGKAGGIGFRVKRVGRTYTLPPRKARPPIPSSSPSSSNHNEAAGAPLILHSPISPLTPASPTYPDGIATPLWVTKHQSLVPAAFVNFFPLTLDSNMASLRDNQLKIEINSLKKDWASSGYKTRFVVALICEDGPVPGDINDRISSIRRATNLDLKNIFVLPPTPSQEDFRDFVRSLFSSLQGPCVEYYRDLSKHARRKRNRGSIPPPTAPPTTGTSQTLAAQGWNIRYEFKLGVFAEFRQEIDAACRSYESAYALLFGEEVFETIAGWSPRFDDARMLADVLAIRIIRCLLWTEQTTLAVRVWLMHEKRIKDIVGSRGKGTNNYGWEAWEARWSLVMADLMRRADLSVLKVPSHAADSDPIRQATIYAPPEETISANERLYPWELLHHAGYWLNRAAKHTSRRRLLAEKIPDEDRSAPTQASPAQAKGRSNVYDTYLAPEPFDEYPLSGSNGTNHSKLIISYLTASSEEFSKRGQLRMVESQKLDMAREHMRLGEWEIALDILQSIWPVLTWRRDGWWHLMEEFGWALRECAHHVGHSETIIRVDWELMNRCFTPRVGWSYDLKRGVVDLPTVEPKPSIVFKEEEVISFLSASFAFQKLEGNVGEPLQSQLVIGSCAHGSASPISLTEVKVTFEGSLRPIKLQASHEAAIVACNQTEISNITLSDSLLSDSASILSHPSNLPSMISTADLTLAPGQTRVFNLIFIPREAGEVKVSSITLMFEDDRFDITYVVTQQPSKESVWWTLGKKGAMSRRIGKDRDTSACNILPKPPKVLITTPSLRNHYYTDEHMVLDVLVDNEEDEPAEISVEVRLLGQSEASAQINWADEPDADAQSNKFAPTTPTGSEPPLGQIKRRSIGIVDATCRRTLPLMFTDTSMPQDYELEISAFYHLVSDPATPIFKTVTLDLSFIRPFEANYELMPRVHPDAWPDFFHLDEPGFSDESESRAHGLQQRWCLNCKIISFAHEALLIDEVEVTVNGIAGGLVRQVGPALRKDNNAAEILPEQVCECDFNIELQRLALDDRQTTTLNLSLDIRWRRQGAEVASSSTIEAFIPKTTLPIPRFVIPMGEPRVLATVMPSSSALSGFIHLNYTLENPSMHLLTFNITMEASDQFAFSGPKSIAVQLVPLSRHTIQYNLLATGKDKWIQPQLVVVDSYYNKTLRVLPTEGMKADKKGILIHIA
ncbi:hypothetical protein D8B26_006830 [Coccidioides posadasii str. Silveira]|uniref:Uncharacterized protein n=1 Tax=Coccidioides posadasii (strain C735) TaxID=222929 RepID=C5P618_COCP7|nr:hypothetical protein CPC735_034940 [Coccidioides posadasii C735 delta SOWgp]EER28158.1 hypothetical protein CPC735_034940 [Coccidioides posadasii C735 delta SOWgp]QVM12195.1 hypothetical protein D8B26_006830 [Coccidioides posadasii str. Silveira]|eukprot:XP_003070303.1 hypothetical protein CPC735_034940 [Coccidioides posadasii C735 delta SOWgp]